jgi:hypothetical protein
LSFGVVILAFFGLETVFLTFQENWGIVSLSSGHPDKLERGVNLLFRLAIQL